MSFNPIEHPLAFLQPKMMSDVSAWIEHIPFAFAMVDMCRPQTLVELGTQKGDSYCAFCQAIDTLKLPTKAYAVDTWRGDSHTGQYDQGALAQLRAHHDPQYSRFSTLMQKTFDDARESFADGAIDLLHIDGLHTYEAVRHDFETWRPKLSDRAVVLFHDTAVRVADFGVYRLFAELAKEYPAFEFEHGFGLGVLKVGRNAPEKFCTFLDEAISHPLVVREFFVNMGRQMDLLRILWTAMHAGVQIRSILNEWHQLTGKPAPVAADMNTPHKNPFNFFIQLMRDVRNLAAEDLQTRRQQGNA